jgi:predicted amidohydrolase YtcJ
MSLLIRNVEVDGDCGVDVKLDAGRITAVGRGLPRDADELDGQGGALIPGLCDHIHLFALAGRMASVILDGARTAADVSSRIALALSRRPAGDWVRATGYHEDMAGSLNRELLDHLAPHHRLRVQHQTGSLWILNSLALESLGGGDLPAGLERDSIGRPTGRLWREDGWLRTRIGAEPPRLGRVGQTLASFGVTSVTDASVTTDPGGAALLAQAHRSGELPQRLTLMSGGPLDAPDDGAFSLGPVKVLLDDHALPDFDDFGQQVVRARAWGRAVAVHCVTAGELALTLAVLAAEGALPGDRIEHGGVIPYEAIDRLVSMGLTVVTQSTFVGERGDRYMSAIDPREHSDLYRCASLMSAGVRVAGSSDAPYASPDPWIGIQNAVHRRTASGAILGAEERVDATAALGMYLDDAATPGRRSQRVEVGAPADLCLLKCSLVGALENPAAEVVRATIVAGKLVFGPTR